MPKVDRYYEAMLNWQKARRTMSNDEVELGFSSPTVQKVFADAGFSGEEARQVVEAVNQAKVVVSLFETPGINADSVAQATSVNMENVRFWKDNQADLQLKQNKVDAVRR